MLNRYARAFFTKLLTPVAKVLIRLGISPDVVTVIGTLGVCFGALAFYPRGELFVGTLVITAFVFSDTLDGIMARRIGRSGQRDSPVRHDMEAKFGVIGIVADQDHKFVSKLPRLVQRAMHEFAADPDILP